MSATIRTLVKSGKFTFPKDARLLKPKDFRRVFEQPIKIHTSGFSLFARISTVQQPRLGLAIPKKAVRRAVDRNRIKRLVRENFRKKKNQLVKFDIIFLGRADLLGFDNRSIDVQLDKAWKRLEKKCEKS